MSKIELKKFSKKKQDSAELEKFANKIANQYDSEIRSIAESGASKEQIVDALDEVISRICKKLDKEEGREFSDSDKAAYEKIRTQIIEGNANTPPLKHNFPPYEEVIKGEELAKLTPGSKSFLEEYAPQWGAHDIEGVVIDEVVDKGNKVGIKCHNDQGAKFSATVNKDSGIQKKRNDSGDPGFACFVKSRRKLDYYHYDHEL